jgi:hypothetical protein
VEEPGLLHANENYMKVALRQELAALLLSGSKFD